MTCGNDAVKNSIKKSSWLEFLSNSSNTTSSTSICLKIKEKIVQNYDKNKLEDNLKKLLFFFETENIAYDINSYRDAPLGIRIWGGATVNENDIKILMEWLEWGFNNYIKENK